MHECIRMAWIFMYVCEQEPITQREGALNFCEMVLKYSTMCTSLATTSTLHYCRCKFIQMEQRRQKSVKRTKSFQKPYRSLAGD